MRDKRLLFVLITMLALAGCKSSQRPAKADTDPLADAPQWVKQRPVDPAYYIGIGMASKKDNPVNYRLDAQQNALSEMAGEIKVNIRVNSTLFTSETNNRFEDKYREFIQMKTVQDLEGYEVVDTYENDDSYWVFYRLAKSAYRSSHEAARQLAIERVLPLFKEAVQHLESNDHVEAVKDYYRALIELQPYLGEGIMAKVDGENRELGAYAVYGMKNILEQIDIVPKSSPVIVYSGLSPGPIAVSVLSGNSVPVSNYPLIFRYSDGIIRPRKATTPETGVISASIDKIRQAKAGQFVKVITDREVLFPEHLSNDNAIAGEVVAKLELPSATIGLTVKPATFAVQVQGEKVGQAMDRPIDAFARYLSGKGLVAENTQKALLLITIETGVADIGMRAGLYYMKMTYRITAVNRVTGVQLYASEPREISTAKPEKESAVADLWKRLAGQISDIEAPRFYRYLMK